MGSCVWWLKLSWSFTVLSGCQCLTQSIHTHTHTTWALFWWPSGFSRPPVACLSQLVRRSFTPAGLPPTLAADHNQWRKPASSAQAGTGERSRWMWTERKASRHLCWTAPTTPSLLKQRTQNSLISNRASVAPPLGIECEKIGNQKVIGWNPIIFYIPNVLNVLNIIIYTDLNHFTI